MKQIKEIRGIIFFEMKILLFLSLFTYIYICMLLEEKIKKIKIKEY